MIEVNSIPKGTRIKLQLENDDMLSANAVSEIMKKYWSAHYKYEVLLQMIEGVEEGKSILDFYAYNKSFSLTKKYTGIGQNSVLDKKGIYNIYAISDGMLPLPNIRLHILNDVFELIRYINSKEVVRKTSSKISKDKIAKYFSMVKVDNTFSEIASQINDDIASKINQFDNGKKDIADLPTKINRFFNNLDTYINKKIEKSLAYEVEYSNIKSEASQRQIKRFISSFKRFSRPVIAYGGFEENLFEVKAFELIDKDYKNTTDTSNYLYLEQVSKNSPGIIQFIAGGVTTLAVIGSIYLDYVQSRAGNTKIIVNNSKQPDFPKEALVDDRIEALQISYEEKKILKDIKSTISVSLEKTLEEHEVL